MEEEVELLRLALMMIAAKEPVVARILRLRSVRERSRKRLV